MILLYLYPYTAGRGEERGKKNDRKVLTVVNFWKLTGDICFAGDIRFFVVFCSKIQVSMYETNKTIISISCNCYKPLQKCSI